MPVSLRLKINNNAHEITQILPHRLTLSLLYCIAVSVFFPCLSSSGCWLFVNLQIQKVSRSHFDDDPNIQLEKKKKKHSSDVPNKLRLGHEETPPAYMQNCKAAWESAEKLRSLSKHVTVNLSSDRPEIFQKRFTFSIVKDVRQHVTNGVKVSEYSNNFPIL